MPNFYVQNIITNNQTETGVNHSDSVRAVTEDFRT